MIEVLFFAQLQEEVGKKSVQVTADDLTVNDIIAKCAAEYDIKELLDEAMIAVNEEYSNRNTVLTAGDVVAFIPPVSGG